MSWNNGYERRKFEQEQKAQAKEYRKCGMNEEQIQAMYLQDLQEYRNNRVYAIHIPSIEELESDGEESRNVLHKKFLLSMTCTMDMSECGRYGWIDEIENNALYCAICKLNTNQKELLTLLYEQVQKLMDAKSAVLKNHNKGKRRTGRMQHTTVYGRLMICQCGNKFNLRFHSRDGRTDGVDYQCYTSVNRGSVAKRLNKGISIEHSCESPYIQGWKLEMMAEQVFDRYIENADKVMDLSYAMLEKHIADQEELSDNTDVIQRKQGEIEKLMNKRTNLIEMRAEGDIDKEMFRSKKQEIEDRVAKLTEEIKGLQPEKEQTSNEDYSVKLLELRERLKEYTGFDYSVIPESIVEAFIERIWVSKDEFRWYLRTGNNADGEFDPDDHIKIGAFTLTIDDAKKYIYSFSTRRRVYKWADLNVSVWI